MNNVLYSDGDFEITKREAIFSVTIVIVMICIGIFISNIIKSSVDDENDAYYSAVMINDASVFEYAMQTNYGNAFVHGDMSANDPVSYSGVKGTYISESWIEEEYTRHVRVVHTGKTTSTQVYHTWDQVDEGSKHCERVTFCGSEFPYRKFDFGEGSEITTVYKTSKLRYTYYGISDKSSGSIFAKLSGGTIPDGTKYYAGYSNDDLIKNLVEAGTVSIVIFWIIWIIFTGFLIFLFYSVKNKWLEDN